MESFITAIQDLMKTDTNFPQRIKEQLVLNSNHVTNPYKFIAELVAEGVLCDRSSDPEASFGLKEIMVQHAITIACSKGADAFGGLIKALKESGNIQLISSLRTWAKENFAIETGGEFSESKEDALVVESPAIKELPVNVNDPASSSSSATKLMDKIMKRGADDFMEAFERLLSAEASPQLVDLTEFCTRSVHQKVQEGTDILPTELRAPAEQQIGKAIKAASSETAVGSFVLALDSSDNESMATYDWPKTSEARKKNYPISVKSLANKPRPTATGIFAATTTGLISVDLETLDATLLTSDSALAVAVNHDLEKIYWSEGLFNSSIMRSNFDGSAKEMIVSPIGQSIYMLAIDEASGDIYFAPHGFREITVCDALGKNRASVIIDSSYKNFAVGLALDSANGVMYLGGGESSSRHLVRANLDGSNATIISRGFDELYGITLDQPSNNVLYWVDMEEHKIGTVDVNCGRMRTLVELKTYSRPWGIQVDANKIYFSNVESGNIQSVDKDSGKELTTIFVSKGGVTHLALFNAPVK